MTESMLSLSDKNNKILCNEITENKLLSVQITKKKSGNPPARFNFIHPTYTFEVVTYTPKSLVDLAPYPNSLENLILNLQAQDVVINNRKYKHGDRFTEMGSRAIRVKNLYVDSSNPVLKIVCDDGYRFENNRCILDCSEGEKACSGVCSNILTDTENCGSCGNVCDSGFTCVDGFCIAPS